MYFCEKRELNCLKRLILQRIIYIILMDSNNLTPYKKVTGLRPPNLPDSSYPNKVHYEEDVVKAERSLSALQQTVHTDRKP